MSPLCVNLLFKEKLEALTDHDVYSRKHPECLTNVNDVIQVEMINVKEIYAFSISSMNFILCGFRKQKEKGGRKISVISLLIIELYFQLTPLF